MPSKTKLALSDFTNEELEFLKELVDKKKFSLAEDEDRLIAQKVETKIQNFLEPTLIP